MRTYYKISFIFVFVLVVAVLVCVFVNIANDDMASVDGKTHINILCLGIDEVADNTDTMILVSLDLNERSVCLLHIPRDTYFEKNTSNKKINNIYSTCLSDGDKCMDALLHTKQSISQAFSVPIDYCISFGLDSVSTVIDSVGGVELDIPCDMDYTDDTQQLNIHLKKGIQSLNGEQSLLFLRYRNTYLEGDIGRIDAQKIFISAFIKRVKSAVSPSSIATAFCIMMRPPSGISFTK